MAYVKISDPAIVDLAAVQQIITVVNNHSDYLNKLVNRFGQTYNTDFTQDDFQANFDIANSNIIYGKVTLKPGSTGGGNEETNANGVKYYAKEVTFDTGVSFAEIPNVLLTHNNTDGTPGGQLDIIVSLHNCTTSGFTARAYKPSANNTVSTDIEINYVAFGRM